MAIRLHSVLRDYKLVEKSDATQQNLVFDSYAYHPKSGLTKFSRFIDDSLNGWKDTVIVMDDDQVIGSGEDPRPFIWQDSVCISSMTYNPSQGFINKIYVKNRARWCSLIAPTSIDVGKNWAPFVRDDELYFVHEYSPFRVLKASFLHERDDFMVLETVAEHTIKTRRSFDGYSSYRGGSNAVQIGDVLVGVGHTNVRPHRDPKSIVHRPFFFVYRPDESVSYFSFDFDFPETYNIVDPTSLYLRDGKLYLVTSETQYAWNVTPQIGRSCLYEIDLNGAQDENSFGFGGRRLRWWSYDAAPEKRWFLGAWRRSKSK